MIQVISTTHQRESICYKLNAMYVGIILNVFKLHSNYIWYKLSLLEKANWKD